MTKLTSYWRKVGAIAAKELRVEWRAREVLATMVSFAVLAVVVFGLAFDLRLSREYSEAVVPGVLWVALFFSGTLGLHRSFGAEVERGSLGALLLAPVDRSAIYLGKLAANVLFLLVTALLLLPLMTVFFDINALRPAVVVALGLGALGYGAAGTLFAALTASLRARETLLPVLLLPVLVPLFMAGVSLTSSVITGGGWDEIAGQLTVLVAMDLIFVTVAILTFDLIWEDFA